MSEFLSGILEGFYGRAWSQQDRLDYAQYLPRSGLNSAIYCPKGDPYLRHRWWQDWPAEQWGQLQQLSTEYRASGLNWGVGLSPLRAV